MKHIKMIAYIIMTAFFSITLIQANIFIGVAYATVCGTLLGMLFDKWYLNK